MTATNPGLPDYFPYRDFVASGVIENADGSYFTAFEVSGPDQEFAEFRSVEALADHVNELWARFDNGWLAQSFSFRVPVSIPPARHQCPDPVSRSIFEERAAQYTGTGTHYETKHVLTLTYLPPAEVEQKVTRYYFQGARRREARSALLTAFVDATEEMRLALSHFLTIRRLEDEEVFHFLSFCITGEERWGGVPAEGEPLHYALGAIPVSLHEGQVGTQHVRVIGLFGFPERGLRAQMFESILALPYALRLSVRCIFLSRELAVKELRGKANDWRQLNWFNPKARWGGGAANNDAENQGQSVDRAITEIQEGQVKGGWLTTTVVVQDANEQQVEARALDVVQRLNRLGFSAHVETDQAADAWFGSLPCHGHSDVRKPLLTTRHFTHLWPTSLPWRGEAIHPNPYYPKNSGPLILASSGTTPYCFNLHDHDLGNFILCGKSGSGKSYLEGAIGFGHRQFERSQINIFDREYAQLIPTLACGGAFYDTAVMQFAPLAHVEDEAERAWAQRLIEKMAELRHFSPTPQAQADIAQALEVVATSPAQHRTMTNFWMQLQTHVDGLKAALHFYTIGQGGAALDGIPGPAQENAWQTWEMKNLLGQGIEISRPVIMYLLRQIERRLDGRPTLTIIEEAWQIMAEEWLEQYTQEASANYRKQVNALGLVIHAPSDLAMFPHRDRILNNTATMVFCADELADTGGEHGQRQHYEALGLGRRAIHTLATGMQPRRDYLCKQGEKYRIFQLNCGPLAHALLSKNGRDYRARVFALQEEYGEAWVEKFLGEQGDGGAQLEQPQRKEAA